MSKRTPAVIATAHGSLTARGYVGIVQVVELIDDEIDSTTVARCSHRHRLARTARACAERLGKTADVRRAVAAEIRKRARHAHA